MSPGELDAAVVRRHLMALEHAVRVLERQVGVSAAELEREAEKRWAVERGLQLCAQNVLDIATHVSAAEGLDVPDYASAIESLGKLEVIPSGFAAGLREMAGFRNVLVHGYLAVDLEIVSRVLNERLSDFRSFAAHIERYIRR